MNKKEIEIYGMTATQTPSMDDLFFLCTPMRCKNPTGQWRYALMKLLN